MFYIILFPANIAVYQKKSKLYYYDSVANDQLKGRQTLRENAFIFQQN